MVCVFSLPIPAFLSFLHLACNTEDRERASLSSYSVAFMCHVTENLKIRKS